MGNKLIQVVMKTDYHESELKRVISKKIHTSEFTYSIKTKSLDARNKSRIQWNIQVLVTIDALKDFEVEKNELLIIPYKKRNTKVVVVGSGPAGYFAAYTLQSAGFNTQILERGHDVNKRERNIRQFEQSGVFNKADNYAFGEGGAGTFSDGKLTSRSKHINKEKAFILDTYIGAGAPQEIAFLSHPHLGSDNLKLMMPKLRKMYKDKGGVISFSSMVTDLTTKNNSITSVSTDNETIEGDYFIFATGHSAYETYRMLIAKGVKFRHKNFAIGSRVEHPQYVINYAQWGKEKLSGVKAAEYRLTHNSENNLPVYTFCMCPGGIIVPATPYEHTNIVNGMSVYQRNNNYANSACVAGINLNQLLNKEVDALEALDWLEELEHKFFTITGNYSAPFCSINDFLTGKQTIMKTETSYPLGIAPVPLWEVLPGYIIPSLRSGLQNFSKKLNGFESGIMLGLESKTSAPIQVIRNEDGFCEGWNNLLLAGEGSGYSGGIMSSAADGIKKAFSIIKSE